MRVAFLFNHDQIHQVAHSLPVALALARARDDLSIVLAVGSERLLAEVQRMAGGELGRPNLSVEILRIEGAARRLLARATRRLLPSEKALLLGDNLPFFRSIDALVVSEKTSLLLRTRYRVPGIKLIHTRHGAGDRAIGFDPASAGFDLVLVSGEKIAERLVREAGLPRDRIRMIGYPKFDLVPGSERPFGGDDDPRPVVLYNPHAAPTLSSWYRFGPEVLDWFVRHPAYRLIFAPHVSLFARGIVASCDPPAIRLPGRIAAAVRRAANIHVDLGSVRSTDMTYTEAADIYLGDASSQVYEFMRRPRPCIFLDAQCTDWQGRPSFLHWGAGEVISKPDQLATALADAAAKHACHFRSAQEELLRRTFSMTEEPASLRAASAIAEFLQLPRRDPHGG